jgi:organic radical activating enzyme
MTYAVKSIFRTIQGEGFHAGRAAVFVRFAGCNMWTGKDATRARDAERQGAQCPLWCDTDFVGGEKLSALDIAERVGELANGATLVVLTGGEPLLQVDEALIKAFYGATTATIAIETNGSLAIDRNFGPLVWVTLSPKLTRERMQLERADEIKVVYPAYDPADWDDFPADHRFVQPCDPSAMLAIKGLTKARRNVRDLAVNYVMEHPRWRLSLQTHKDLGIP